MAAPPRIVSLLPSATEMVFALGLGDSLVGVTHECDFPQEARSKPSVVRNALPIESMSQKEIDVAVSERLREGLSLYELDAPLIEELSPDLILTQSLCAVCAPATDEVAELLKGLSSQPEILWMTPRNLREIDDNLRDLGRATGRGEEAAAIIASNQERLGRVAEKSSRAGHRPRVFCMEWRDPVYCSGHWVPEMVQIAGGVDELGRSGGDSKRIPWEDVVSWAPEVLVFMPCGCDLEAALQESSALTALPGFAELPAARNGRVYAVDASAYFARPGPRVIEGAELLAHLIHPDIFEWGCRGAASNISLLEQARIAASP